MDPCFSALTARTRALSPSRCVGRVSGVHSSKVHLSGVVERAAIGDQVSIFAPDGKVLTGEVVQLHPTTAEVLTDGPTDGIRLECKAILTGPATLAVDESWIGRIIDPNGRPLDAGPLAQGGMPVALQASPPSPTRRRAFGPRLETGLAAFNTFLPIVRGQRVGLFAGSGVGKSHLLGLLARHVKADLVVIALIGERGREVGEFARDVLGAEGLARSIIVAATSDSSALTRRRCAPSAMAIAEYFRDRGQSVLLLADSVTRFAEAHRDTAVAMGESIDASGFPASLSHQITRLCERAGTGCDAQGDITAIFTVLVAKSDMDGPVADILRGVLDGHVVLDRDIAERGRFPAINILRSVSRSLPAAASVEENALITQARQALGRYHKAELMIQSGLYAKGSDPETDHAIACWPALDAFVGKTTPETISESFEHLSRCVMQGETV